VLFASAYGVPDAQAGDQVMAALVLRDRATFDPDAFASWLDEQTDLGPKWHPRYVRITGAMPTSPTNKILKRVLVHEKFRPDRTNGSELWFRPRQEHIYRPFGDAQAKELEDEFAYYGRERFWDL
jgi:fatty-acyl-CoA synthase